MKYSDALLIFAPTIWIDDFLCGDEYHDYKGLHQ